MKYIFSSTSIVFGIVILLALSWERPLIAQTSSRAVATPQGIERVKSMHSFEVTWKLLNKAIEANPSLKIVAIVDHADNARKVGQNLRPTRLIIFGNPQMGTPLMTSSQTAALDLPQKMVVFEDENGDTFVAYNSSAYIAERHSIPRELPALKSAETGLGDLAKAATSR